jgi:hypothetical protein
MVFVFFHLQGAIFTNHIPKGTTVNTVDTRTWLQRFLKVAKENKPDMAASDWYSPGTMLM